MTSTTGTYGRLCNQIIRNLAVSIIASKFNLKVNYFNYELIKKLGIELFIGNNEYDNMIPLTDDNFFSIYNSNILASNLDPNKNFFQTKEISNFIYNYLHKNDIMQHIIDNNPYKERYNTNNDLFIHIRLDDAASFNPGIKYYLRTIKTINFENLYIGSDDFNHQTIKEIIRLYPNAKLIKYDEINTIQFASTCKNIILSHGSFSAIIGYLAFFSIINYPEYNKDKIWFGDMFSIDGWIKHKSVNQCIALLTRGYTDNNLYSMLIERNRCISRNLDDKTIDIIVFNEGNITIEQQKYIQLETPELKIKFINITSDAFKKEKESISFERAHGFGIGYRHMCSFWFVDFWHFVEDYDKLIRIDEDCYINFNIDKLFLNLQHNIFIAGKTSHDDDFVTDGMNKFTNDFINRNKNRYSFKKTGWKAPNGPYTNVFGLSLDKIRNNDILKLYLSDINNSNMIYKRRWGDLPLWGEAIYYFFGNDTLLIDDTIKYYHGSHNANIN